MLVNLCKKLQLSLTASNILKVCEQAQRQQPTYMDFLTEILVREHDHKLESRAQRRIKEAGFPLIKTLEGFNFSKSSVPETIIRTLAQGDYIAKAESIILLGEPGTGKTHLATALGISAALLGIGVKFITASQLVTMLIEAKSNHQLSAIIKRYQNYRLLIMDELGYLPLAKADAELLFQILSQRHERHPIIITTNLPFSEWTSIFTDHRLCKALIDRVTYKAHIIETGDTSIRLEETLATYKGGKIKNN